MGLRYTYDFTDEEEKILLDSILDIKGWFDDAIKGKISNCTGHGAKRWKEHLIKKGVTTMKAEDKDLITDAFQDPDYKNRSQRDQEELLT